MAIVEWTYQSVVESEDKMLTDLSAFLEENDISAEIMQACMLAVSEAFTNAIIHGNRLDPSKTVRVRIDANEYKIVADIIDEGVGGLKKIASRPTTEALAENGRGIALIEYYSSKTVFSATNSGGLCVSIDVSYEDCLAHSHNLNNNEGGDYGNIDKTGRGCRHSESERQT